MVFGMAAAFLFMAVYYKLFGVIADLVLVFNVVLLTALLSFGRRLDLARHRRGGAHRRHGGGREHADLRAHPRGAARRVAARRDHGRLRPRVLGDLRLQRTASIAGVVLWLFGAGAVRGFAVVLMLGIVTSMFTALMGSRDAGAAHLRR